MSFKEKGGVVNLVALCWDAMRGGTRIYCKCSLKGRKKVILFSESLDGGGRTALLSQTKDLRLKYWKRVAQRFRGERNTYKIRIFFLGYLTWPLGWFALSQIFILFYMF